jgi:hypothetical protein
MQVKRHADQRMSQRGIGADAIDFTLQRETPVSAEHHSSSKGSRYSDACETATRHPPSVRAVHS